MTYHKQLTKHLGAYRRETLGLEEPGAFEHKGLSLPKAHVLQPEMRWLNVLPGVKELIETYVQDHGVQLHRYFHHLNSSQAFALNLFVPYFEGGPAASCALLHALGVKGTLAAWKPEDVPYAEEGTNLDVSWWLESGEHYISEVKLSESGFGSAKQDEEHVRKLAEIYAPILRKHVGSRLLEPKPFCRNYQIMRLAWCVVKGEATSLMFLIPRANPALWRKLSSVLPGFTEELRSRVCLVAMEDVIDRLAEARELSSDLEQHAIALKRKYVLPLKHPSPHSG